MGTYRQFTDQCRREHKADEKLNPATPAMMKRAKQLGEKAFLAGKHAPAQDAKILDMCEGKPRNTQIKLMTTWQKAWTAAHIKKTDAELRASGFYD